MCRLGDTQMRTLKGKQPQCNGALRTHQSHANEPTWLNGEKITYIGWPLWAFVRSMSSSNINLVLITLTHALQCLFFYASPVVRIDRNIKFEQTQQISTISWIHRAYRTADARLGLRPIALPQRSMLPSWARQLFNKFIDDPEPSSVRVFYSGVRGSLCSTRKTDLLLHDKWILNLLEID